MPAPPYGPCIRERYLTLLHEVIEDGNATGNMIVDAAIVALCREHGVDELMTADKDFHRFSSIRVVPLPEA